MMSISSGLVAMMVMSSVYAIAVVLASRDPSWSPCIFFLTLIGRELINKEKSSMLNGQT